MKAKKMKAIISTNYGGPEVLKIQEVDQPTPKDNEVLVKIFASNATTAETMMRTGYPLIGRLFMGLTKPKNSIPGTGFAGEIIAIGKDVRIFKIGDQVFGESNFNFGTHAEYLCLDEEGIIAIKPKNISYEEAAVVGDGPITSLNFLKNLANIQPGQSILINGASGSLGTAAVQLAKNLGATVTGVSSTRNLAFVKSLGADHVIDYTLTDFTKTGEKYDIIYDTVGKSSFRKCKKALTEKGIYMSPVLDFSLLLQMIWTSIFGNKRALFSATGMLPKPDIQSLLKDINKLLKKKKLKSFIDRSYPLEQLAEAHRFIDKGHKRGNVVIVR